MWFHLVVLAVPLAAPGVPMTFTQLRTLSVERAPDVRLAAVREDVARAGVLTAGGWLNPTLTVTTAVQTARLSSGVSLPLPVFGQLGVAREAAEADLSATRADSKAVRQQVLADSSLAWVELWTAQARSKLFESASADAQRLAGVSRERFEAGTAPQVDVVRAKAVRAQAVADATTQAAAVGATAARLETWLGPRPEEGWRAEGEPSFPAAPPHLEDLMRALATHPALARDEEAIKAASAHLRSEERQRLPVIAALLTVNVGDPGLPTPSSPDVIGGLAFELPVLNQRAGPIAKARAEEALSRQQADADQLRLRAALREAHASAVAAGDRVIAFENEVVPAATQARAMTEEGYRDGRVDLLRLLEAQRAVIDARLSALEARATYLRAMIELERASGLSLTEAQ